MSPKCRHSQGLEGIWALAAAWACAWARVRNRGASAPEDSGNSLPVAGFSQTKGCRTAIQLARTISGIVLSLADHTQTTGKAPFMGVDVVNR